jgi:hypothetical protein
MTRRPRTWLAAGAWLILGIGCCSNALAAGPTPQIWFRVNETTGTSDTNPGTEFTTGDAITNLGLIGRSGLLRERGATGDPEDDVTISARTKPPTNPAGVIALPGKNGSGASMNDGGVLDPIDGKGDGGVGPGPDTRLTVAAWVNFDTEPAQPATVACKTGGKTGGSVMADFDSGWQLAVIAGSSPAMRKLYFNWGNRDSVNLNTSSADLPVAELAGKWNHVAATFDETGNEVTVRLYRNGKDIGGVDNFGGPVDVGMDANDLPLAIGTMSAGNWQWPGKIAEVQVFDAALSKEQIQRLAGETQK